MDLGLKHGEEAFFAHMFSSLRSPYDSTRFLAKLTYPWRHSVLATARLGEKVQWANLFTDSSRLQVLQDPFGPNILHQ